MKRYVILIVIVAVFAFLVLGGLIAAGIVGNSYNSLTRLSQQVDQQWAQVQNVYQRRADLVPNLVQTVAGAANFEKSTLVEVTNARASVGQVKIDPSHAPADPQSLAKFQQAQDQLSGALSRLLVVVERYPELHATANFATLQAQLEGTENRIAVERGRFNEAVRNYDTAIRSIPAVFWAGSMGFTPRPYFQAAPGAQKVPAVRFDFNSTPAPASAAPAK